ncbi:MAG: protein kinase [Kofleriaceae bacterium]
MSEDRDALTRTGLDHDKPARRAEPAALRTGQQVGHYTVEERLGAGGFGEVYRARHERIGREVAIKVLHERRSHDPDAVARFVAEARAVNQVLHPGIVEIFDFGALPDGRDYFVMELLRGRSLRQLLDDRGRLPIAEAMPILEQIAAAIDAAHAAGIAHRDLKPDNVFVLATGRVKLIDFGLAKLVDGSETSLTETGHITGTPLYMSPEQFRGKPIDTRTDAYSFGVLAYHVLVGAPPFTGSDAMAVAFQHINDPPDPPSAREPSLGAAVDRWLLPFLAKDREARPHPLSSGLPTAKPIAAPRRGRLWLVAVAALLVVIGVAVAWWPSDGAAPVVAAAGPKRVAIVAVPAAGSDASLAPVIARMVRRRLREVRGRSYWLVDTAADVTVELTYGASPDRGVLEARVGHRAIAAGAGGSIAGAITVLIDPLAIELGRGEPAPVEPGERADMELRGARSVVAYRRFATVQDAIDESYFPDMPAIASELEAVILEDPTWAHPYVLLGLALGATTPEALAAFARGRAHADLARDRIGAAVLEASLPGVSAERGVRILDAVPGGHADQLLAMPLWVRWMELHRIDDAIAIAKQVHHAHPELQYGVDLAVVMRPAGRAAEADQLVRDWATAYPESQQALLELAVIEARSGQRAAGLAHLARRRLLLGESTAMLGLLCDAYIELGDLTGAHRLVDSMLTHDGLVRANGRYRAGVLAIREGRFGVAYDALKQALQETRPFGMQSELTQVVTTLRSIAGFAGQPGDEARLRDEAIAAFGHVPGTLAALTYERALANRKAACPPVEPLLATLPDDASRSTARRRMVRAASEVGCATCAEVVAAGLSSDETSARSLIALGLCAERRGNLDMARLSLERAAGSGQLQPERSPYHETVALLHLARVVAKQGDRARAKALYTELLDRWGRADRVLPEVTEARAALAQFR